MGVLADKQIVDGAFIKPFEAKQRSSGTISWGLGSYGYDVRVGNRFLLCRMKDEKFVEEFKHKFTIDPKKFDADLFDEKIVNECIDLPPHSFALAETVEYLEIPRDVIAICVGKSTYARCGIIVNVTPLEPEWRGKITLEISNTTPMFTRVYAGEGIAQILFLRGDQPCDTTYADRKGRYQNQTGLTLPFVESKASL